MSFVLLDYINTKGIFILNIYKFVYRFVMYGNCYNSYNRIKNLYVDDTL